MPDCHLPVHDKKAFSLMLDIAADFSPDEVVIIGDFFDCASVSDYMQDPTKAYSLLKDEVAEAHKSLRFFHEAIGPAKVVFLEGNHENRIFRYQCTYASKLGGIIKTEEALQLPKAWKFIPYGPRNIHRCGPKLIATHGSLCGSFPAKAMASKYGISVIFGHTHRVQNFTIRNVNGHRIEGINIGWLGDLETAAEYIKNVADWSHAFAVGYFEPNGEYHIQTIEIEGYKCVFDGKLYAR